MTEPRKIASCGVRDGVGVTGLERIAETPMNSSYSAQVPNSSGAASGAGDAMAAFVESLTAEQRAALAAMLQVQKPTL